MPDYSHRGLVREALKDVAWGYVGEAEAGRMADEMLQRLPDLITSFPLAFNLGVEMLPPDGRYVRVVGEWEHR